MSKVKKVSSKESTPKTPHKKKLKKNPESLLQQAFKNSLKDLQSYWNKKTTSLKKQIESLRQKHQKAVSKQKATKEKRALAKSPKTLKAHEQTQQKVLILQEALNETRLALTQAKACVTKYVHLNKVIEQCEQEHSKEFPPSTPPKKTAPKPKNKKMKDVTPFAIEKKRGRKPKSAPSPETQENIPLNTFDDETLIEETQNIFIETEDFIDEMGDSQMQSSLLENETLDD